MKTIVVSAVNLRKGGTLTILRQYLNALGKAALSDSPASVQDTLRSLLGGSPELGTDGNIRVVALVHRRELCDFPGVEYIEIPWAVKGWGRRLWCEYVTMHRISRNMAEENGTVWLWLSLHDTTPRVVAEHRAVYCHTSFPFLKVIPRDWKMDPKVPLFALFTKWAYRINVRRNDFLIVQQNWFADALSGLLKMPRERFRVIAPASAPAVTPSIRTNDGGPVTFFYASTPDCHKNFETLCRAAEMLDKSGLRFRVVLTVAGDENRYARWLHSRWGSFGTIDFHGFMSKEELFGTYASADCFVFPSRVETWGLPVSEFIAVKRPDAALLLADLPYAHETSAGADAMFFPATDASALAVLMKTVIENKS